MGRRIMKEYWCDTCGYTSNDKHDFYHNHGKYTDGYGLDILDNRLTNAKNEKEKFEELCDWFGFHPGENSCNVRFAKYDETIIKCIVQAMREGNIHNDADCECECSEWYRSAPETADYIESKIPDLKIAYNHTIDRAVNKAQQVFDEELSSLKNRKIN